MADEFEMAVSLTRKDAGRDCSAVFKPSENESDRQSSADSTITSTALNFKCSQRSSETKSSSSEGSSSNSYRFPAADDPQALLIEGSNVKHNFQKVQLRLKGPGDTDTTLTPSIWLAKIQDGKLQMNQDAICLLKTIALSKPVAVLTICGPNQSGKSFFLSRMLDTTDAFKVSSECSPCTKGIWMSTIALECSDFVVVLLNTEGTNVAQESEDFSADVTKLLVLTTLLSSYLIYNTKGAPQQTQLDEMSWFSDFAKSMLLREGSSVSDHLHEQKLQSFLPRFLWLLQDNILEAKLDGKPASVTEYMKKEIFVQSKQNSEQACRRNEIVRIILALFPSLECKQTPPPSNVTTDDNKFLATIDEVAHFLLTNIQPKKSFDYEIPLHGAVLANLAEQYVHALNESHALPNVNLEISWIRAVKQHLMERCKALVSEYVQEMHQRLRTRLPIEEGDVKNPHAQQPSDTLVGMHQEIYAMKFSIIETEAFQTLPSNKETTDKLLTDHFQKKILHRQHDSSIKGEFFHFVEENSKLSQQYCEELFETLCKEQDDIQLQNLKAEYFKKAIGPAKEEVFKRGMKNIAVPPLSIEIDTRNSSYFNVTWKQPSINPDAVPGKPDRPQKPTYTIDSPTKATFFIHQLMKEKENVSPVTQIIVESCTSSLDSKWEVQHVESQLSSFKSQPALYSVQVDLTGHKYSQSTEEESFFYQVRFKNEAGESEPSDYIKISTKEMLPGVVQFSEYTQSKARTVEIRWQPPKYYPSSAHYFEVRSKQAGESSATFTKETKYEECMAIIEGLQPDTEYLFQVCGVNANNEKGKWNEITVKTKPDCPNAPSRPSKEDDKAKLFVEQNDMGQSEPSPICVLRRDDLIPGEPSEVREHKVHSHSITVCWKEPVLHPDAVDCYYVQYKEVLQSDWIPNSPLRCTGTTCTLPDLIPNTEYEYRVYAVNKNGKCGKECPATARTDAYKPTHVRVRVTPVNVAKITARNPSIQESGSPITHIRLYSYNSEDRQFTNSYHIVTFNDDENEVEINVPIENDMYSFRISFINEKSESEQSDTVEINTSDLTPGEISSLIKEEKFDGIDLYWSKPEHIGRAAKDYEVEIEINGNWNKFKTQSCTEFRIRNLKPCTKYRVRVRAVNGKLKSEFTEKEVNTIAAPPLKPRIESIVMDDAEPQKSLIRFYRLTEEEERGSPVDSVELQWSYDNEHWKFCMEWNIDRIGRNQIIQEEFQLPEELEQARTTFYHIIMCSRQVKSEPSEAHAIESAQLRPGQVEDLQVTRIQEYSVTLQWNTPAINYDAIQKYVINCYEEGVRPTQIRKSEVKPDCKTIIMKSLAPGQTYTFEVYAKTQKNIGHQREVKATTVFVFQAPQDIHVEFRQRHAVKFRWSKPSQPESPAYYRVYVRNTGFTGLTRGMSTVIRDLQPSSQYAVEVTSMNNNGNCVSNSTATATIETAISGWKRVLGGALYYRQSYYSSNNPADDKDMNESDEEY